MARIRSTHPGIWTDEAFVSVSFPARLLFMGIWNEADDQGVFEWKPVTLKMRLMPMDPVDVAALLAELAEQRMVLRYEVDGRIFGAVRNFRRFQRPEKPNAIHPLTDEVRSFVALSTTSHSCSRKALPPLGEASATSRRSVGDQSANGRGKSGQMEEGEGEGEGEEESFALSSPSGDAPAPDGSGEAAPPPLPTAAAVDDPVSLALAAWEAICVPAGLSRVAKATDPRRRAIAARLRVEFGGDLERWRDYLRRIAASAFLTGGGDRGWKADLDWAVTPKNVVRVLEGFHDDRGRAAAAPKPLPALDERYWNHPPAEVRQLPKPRVGTPERLAWDEAQFGRSAPHPSTRRQAPIA